MRLGQLIRLQSGVAGLEEAAELGLVPTVPTLSLALLHQRVAVVVAVQALQILIMKVKTGGQAVVADHDSVVDLRLDQEPQIRVMGVVLEAHNLAVAAVEPEKLAKMALEPIVLVAQAVMALRLQLQAQVLPVPEVVGERRVKEPAQKS